MSHATIRSHFHHGHGGSKQAPRLATQIIGLGWSAVSIVPRWLAKRRLMATMSGMSVRELADVGLTQQDVGDLSSLPLSSDVGAFLTMRAGEARHWRR